MPIAVTCGCGKQFRVPDEYVGKKIKCTSCGETRVVVAAAPNGTAKNGTPRGSAAVATPPAPAVVKFQCDACNQPMQAKAEFAGKKTRCPACQSSVTIPGSEDEAVVAEEVEEEESPQARIQAGKPQPKKAAKRPVEEAEEIEEIEEIEEEAEEIEEEEERPKGRIQSGRSLKKASSKQARDEEDIEEAEEIEEEDEEDDRPRKGKKGKKPLKKTKRSGMGLMIGLAVGALLLLGGGVVALVMLLGGSGGDDLAMIPSDAQVFAVVRVKDLWKQPLVQEVMRQANQKAGKDLAAEFQKEAGMPPDEIERVTFVGLDSSMEKAWTAITTTKAIDKAQSIEKMKLNPTELTHQGKTYLKSKAGAEVVHFASSRMLIVTPNEASMKLALEQLTGSRKASGKLGNAISLAGKNHVVVGFVIPPEMGKMMGGGPKPRQGAGGFGPDITPLLEAQSGTVTADLNGNTIQYGVSGDFPDAAKATKAKEMLDQLKASIPTLAAFMPDKQMADELNKAATAMTLSMSGNTVTLKGSNTIKNEDLAKMMAGMAGMAGVAGGPMPKPGPGPRPGRGPKPDPGPGNNPGVGGRLTKANYKQIETAMMNPGARMTRAQVEALLGPSTNNAGPDTLIWVQGRVTVTIGFLNGQVVSARWREG